MQGYYNYLISIKKFITDLDKKTLINLYQPILGSKACSIYLTLIEENEIISKLKGVTFNLNRLCSILNTSPEKLEKNIRKLEGMGLVKRTFNKIKNQVTFKIINPLEPSDFFDNVIFEQALKKRLDEDDFEILKFFYRDVEDEQLDENTEEVTFSFDQAFPEDYKELEKESFIEKLKIKKHAMNIESDELVDFSNIEVSMIEKGINPKALTKTIKKTILTNLQSSSFNSEEILDWIVNSYDIEKEIIDKAVLSLLIKNSIFNKVEEKKIDKTDEKVKEFEEHNSSEYIELLKQDKITVNEKTIIKQLSTKYKLKDAAINCLVEYSYWKNNGAIVGNYLYKIAKTINDKAISGTKNIMLYLKDANKYSNKKEQLSLSTVESDLSWMDEEIEEDTFLDD